ncbi:MAG: SDR family NAD(P)-dependent oxidoreductase [Spirochaetaceae bacterium]
MGKTALVTGASSGIGRAFSELLAEQGYDLLLVARRSDYLRAVATDAAYLGVHAETLALDLTDPAAIARLESALAGRELDLCVNSAGVGDFGPFVESSWERNEEMIALNASACMQVFHVVGTLMASRGYGRIIHVASVAAFQPGPLMSVYYASKAYGLSLAEALAEELAGDGVGVTALCPGPTRSPFHDAAGMQIGTAEARSMATAREVAEYGYRAALRGKRVVVFGCGFRVMLFLRRVLPRAVVTRAVGAMQARRRAAGPGAG